MRQSVRYSQNFLQNHRVIEQLVGQSSVTSDDAVLDIGAGGGSITEVLAGKAKQVIAIEADPRLAASLQEKFKSTPSVDILRADFLTLDLPSLPYKVFANIPFNLTSNIVRKLLDAPRPPSDSYIIMQREAAQKFAGEPGRESLFSMLHKPWFHMEIMHTFATSDFQPRPSVDVVLLRASQRISPLVNDSESTLYRDLVSYVYNHANPNVSASLQQLFTVVQLAELETKLGSRMAAKPTELTVADWFLLVDTFKTTGTPAQRALIAGAANKLSAEARTIEKHHRTRQSKNWQAEARKAES